MKKTSIIKAEIKQAKKIKELGIYLIDIINYYIKFFYL